MQQHRHDEATPRHLVRPRWVWGGLLLALLGGVAFGVGIAMTSWTVAVPGVAALVLGCLGGLHGGALYDAVPVAAVRREMRQVRDGDVHNGVTPESRIGTADIRARALRAEATRRHLIDAAGQRHDVRWAPVCGWLLVSLTVVLVVSQWVLVAHSAAGRTNSYRDTAAAVVFGLTGLRLVVAPGRHRLAAALAVLGGGLLVLNAVTGAHDSATLQLAEVGAGLFGAGAALLAAFSPST